jgi:hypothetical protein
MPKRWRFRVIFPIAIVAIGAISFAVSDVVRFVVCSAVGVAVYGTPSQRDWQQADAIRDTITNVHHFAQNSVSQPNRPPIFSNPGSKKLLTQPTVIEVYEVGDRAEQDKIITAVRAVIADPTSKPVDLRFLDHENWIVTDDSGERGPETQLRRVRITRNGIRNEIGEKLITYPSP